MTGNLSLERGLAVLGVLKEAADAVGVRELARRLEQSAPAVQRILNTLTEHGYVEQAFDSRRYRLGASVLALARHMLSKDRLIAAAEPELQALAAEGCFNAFLGVRRGDQGIYLLTVQSRSPVVIRSSPGETFPLHSTALGKAFLMESSRETIMAIIGEGPLGRLTERTITDPEKLIVQIMSARTIGYATSIDENFVGLIAVGAPVRDASGAILGGISVAYPRSVGPHVAIAQVGEAVLGAALRISAALGFERAAETEQRGARYAT
ncbi:IclR family transcriptional regulator [Mesorhizobium sp. B1-1-8]|uniref:IclR family transcriptional regulator n=1 Tax=Mesorhizobium sp. B1-1-8 TaxID=2589976 RepID=UPI0011289560|nr:IclR family transcriptional regulator [Mesorhizobium sp. B1-1-8]UCI10557.1 IclR family transcriptional regulator [Mesorhizobium sp. B1-1-8]